jgi:hypothetical protein
MIGEGVCPVQEPAALAPNAPISSFEKTIFGAFLLVYSSGGIEAVHRA